jgi:hypothetical protein
MISLLQLLNPLKRLEDICHKRDLGKIFTVIQANIVNRPSNIPLIHDIGVDAAVILSQGRKDVQGVNGSRGAKGTI